VRCDASPDPLADALRCAAARARGPVAAWLRALADKGENARATDLRGNARGPVATRAPARN
jgi:hypothetical protein